MVIHNFNLNICADRYKKNLVQYEIEQMVRDGRIPVGDKAALKKETAKVIARVNAEVEASMNIVRDTLFGEAETISAKPWKDEYEAIKFLSSTIRKRLGRNVDANLRKAQYTALRKAEMVEAGEAYGRYMEPEIDKQLAVIDARMEEAQATGDLNLIKDIRDDRIALTKQLEKHYPAALKAKIEGTAKPVPGGHISVNSVGGNLAGKYVSGFEADLRKVGLYDIARSGEIDMDIAKEMFNILKRDEDGNIFMNPDPATDNAQARQIAEIITKYQNEIVYRKNNAGAYIQRLPGRISRNTHDIMRLMNEGKEGWIRFVMDKDLLDYQKTFPGLTRDEILRAMEEVYATLTTGKYLKAGDPRKPLAQKLSEHRELHFKDAESWMAYNDAFGSEDLMTAIVGEFEKAGHDIGAMEVLGPDIRAMRDEMIGHISKLAETNEELAKNWQGRDIDRVMALFDYVDGTSKIPSDNTLASIGRFVRMWNNITKLGRMLFSQVADSAFASAALRHEGDNLFKGYTVALESFFKGFLMPQKGLSAAVRREIADEAGVLVEGMMSAAAERYTTIENMPGRATRVQASFFKWTGSNRWNNAMKTGVANYVAHKLGKWRDLPFNELPEGFQRVFKNHGLGETEWKLIKKVARQADDGRWYITPKQISEYTIDPKTNKRVYRFISNEDLVEAYGNTLTYKNRQDLETKLRAYFFNTINDAVPTPGIGEQTRIKGGTRAGTYSGEALALFAQFKTFPLTALRLLRKELEGKRVDRGIGTDAPRLQRWKGNIGGVDKTGVLNLMIGSTLMGYLAMSLKDISKGRKPRDFTEKPGKVALAAFIQGGGAGIFGDFMFGVQTRYGQGPLEGFLGPTWGTMSQIANLALDTAPDVITGEKDPDVLLRKSFNLLKTNALGYIPLPNGGYIPTYLANMAFSRAALDYLLLYEFQEQMNPGYFNRMNRRLEREYAQESFLQPLGWMD